MSRRTGNSCLLQSSWPFPCTRILPVVINTVIATNSSSDSDLYDLYDGSTCVDMGSFSSFLSDLKKMPSLVEEKKNVCEGKLGYGEGYNALQTFQKSKLPVNDGLTVEFYLAFWPVVGRLFWSKNKPHLPLKRSYMQSIII